MFVLYDILVNFAVVLVLLPYEFFRVITRRSSMHVIRERLGSPNLAARGCVVIHGVSVGELASAAGLVRELESRRPELRILLTTGNASGRVYGAQLQKRHRNISGVAYLPWDRHSAVRSWLEALAPRAFVVIETEIWPNLYRACAELRIPLGVASARLYPRDVVRYRIARGFFSRVLAGVSWIGAASEKERDRFLAIGAAADRVEVTGDLKFSTASIESTASREVGTIVAGCTHPGEEELVFEACNSLAAKEKPLRLVIAPRDVGRARALQRRFHSKPSLQIEVVDSIGSLAPNYSRATIAFLGGSLVAHGGHNPLEALAAGCPVLTGPYLEHVETLVAPFERTGAIEIVRDVTELARGIEHALAMTESERSNIAGVARRIIQREGIAAETTADWLLGVAK